MKSLRSGIPAEFRLFCFRCSTHAFLKHVCQECFVPVPWCGEVCSPRCIFQNWSWSTLQGTILIDNRDIKTLKLSDLRDAMSIGLHPLPRLHTLPPLDTLREWRGEKTLIFSTHRFGNLT
ncbi:hypothetical protein BDR03DRAFT_975128 [Suillus americanus]|nr:hypothetical protein BDR03DRAFT_975128 [Suillus americanus]